DRRTRVANELIRNLAPRVLPDNDFIDIRESEQTRTGVNGVPGDCVPPFARVAASHDDEAGVDTGVHRERAADSWRHFDADVAYHPVQLHRRAHGTMRIVPVRDRNAEKRHDLVADELVDDSAVFFDDPCRLALDAAHDPFDLFRIE